ncbi:hypothetical protein IAT38_005466 [Cryptococcus sp. DSM 104549]
MDVPPGSPLTRVSAAAGTNAVPAVGRSAPPASSPLAQPPISSSSSSSPSSTTSTPPTPTSPTTARPAPTKRRSTLFTLLRGKNSSSDADKMVVPKRQSVFADMERGPQRAGAGLGLGLALRGAGGEEVEMLGQEGEEDDDGLPAVRLVPPEDEGEPMMLYPHPLSPPASIDLHPASSGYSSTPGTPPRAQTPPLAGTPPQRRQPLPSASRPRPQSGYTPSAQWNGMAEGFALPAPKFSRAGAGGGGGFGRGMGGVVMPKKREEVVEERRRRMSGMAEWGTVQPVQPGIAIPVRVKEAEEERAANMVREENEGVGSPVVVESPVAVDSPVVPAPPTITTTRRTTEPAPETPPLSQSPAQPIPPKSPVPKATRRSRTLSLSAAFAAPLFKSDSPTATAAPPVPKLPAPPVPPIPQTAERRVPKKQKSLKNFFFSSSTPPEAVVAAAPSSAAAGAQGEMRKSDESGTATPAPAPAPAKEEKRKSFLHKARSKPSLRIDVGTAAIPSTGKPLGTPRSGSSSITPTGAAGKAATTPTPVTPALSTGRSEGSSAGTFPDTPSSGRTARANPPAPSPRDEAPVPSPRAQKSVSKRFSLSNMSMFKKRSNSMPSPGAGSPSGASSPSLALPGRSGSESAAAGETMGEFGMHASEVPRVPDLPVAYKLEKEAKEAKEAKKEATSAVSKVGVTPWAATAPGPPKPLLPPVELETPAPAPAGISDAPPPVPTPTPEPATVTEPDVIHGSPVSLSPSLASTQSTFDDPSSASIAGSDADFDEEDILNAQFMQLPTLPAPSSGPSGSGSRPISPRSMSPAGVGREFYSAPRGRGEVVVVQEGRRSLEALVVLGPALAGLTSRPVQPRRSHSGDTERDGAMSGSGSEGSFASCDSSSTLGLGMGMERSPRKCRKHGGASEERRGSAESEESEEGEGVVTPAMDSVEWFQGLERGRGRREGSEESEGVGEGEEVMAGRDSEERRGASMGERDGEREEEGEERGEPRGLFRGMVRKFESSRKLRPTAASSLPPTPTQPNATNPYPSSLPPNIPLPPTPTTPPSPTSAAEAEIKGRLGTGDDAQMLKKEKKIGSLHFETLGLDFGGGWQQGVEASS